MSARRPIWTGTISFGLVNIPVRLITAVREKEEIHFHYLHRKDGGRVENVRRCQMDGKDVPWDQIVRGYEYEKGKYLEITEEEIARYRPERTQAIEIRAFVELAQIDPILFDHPYYLEPDKLGRHAYALLRDALSRSGRVGVAEVVLRTRSHLAALKPEGDALVLALLHYGSEVLAPKDLALPAREKASEKEMKAALMLIDAMATDFNPRDYEDTFQVALRKHLDARAKGAPAPKRAAATRPQASNVVHLAAILRRSLKTAAARHAARSKRLSARPSRANA
jgi:DNA end-binding protein Ku